MEKREKHGSEGKLWLRLGVMLCAIFMGKPVWAKTLNVPSEYSTIFNAVLIAQEGDEIVVAPGTYREQVTFLGKNITIRSTFTGDWSVVRNTIIDLEGQADSIIYFGGDETGNCILRGFTLRNGRGAILSDQRTGGTGTHATIEYNIITKNLNRSGTNIENCDGLIQNNIVEGNTASLGAAFSRCDGVIQNNLVRNNQAVGYYYPGQNIPAAGGAFYQCRGTIRNNTVVDNFIGNEWEPEKPKRPGGFKDCTATIVNNIVYHTTMTTPLEYEGSSIPTYCLFRDARPGQGNLAGDPKFVNPAAGEFRLKPDSPAIDAGKAQPDLKADRAGIQRGLKAGPAGRGDGSGMDIGADEALPKPVAVWLPNGGPPTGAKEGKPLAVSWLLEPTAGTRIRLYLLRSGYSQAYLGSFNAASGSATSTVSLPTPLPTREDYAIVGVSAATAQDSATACFKITGANAIPTASWQQYQ